MSELRKKLAAAADNELNDLLAMVEDATNQELKGTGIGSEDVYKLLSSKRTTSIRNRIIRAMVKKTEKQLLNDWNDRQAKVPFPADAKE
jgi:hypothetical protein